MRGEEGGKEREGTAREVHSLLRSADAATVEVAVTGEAGSCVRKRRSRQHCRREGGEEEERRTDHTLRLETPDVFDARDGEAVHARRLSRAPTARFDLLACVKALVGAFPADGARALVRTRALVGVAVDERGVGEESLLLLGELAGETTGADRGREGAAAVVVGDEGRRAFAGRRTVTVVAEVAAGGEAVVDGEAIVVAVLREKQTKSI